MDLGRMAMALQLARFNDRRVTIASAGMPPAYLHRASNGTVEEVAHSATPLGTLGDRLGPLRIAVQSPRDDGLLAFLQGSLPPGLEVA